MDSEWFTRKLRLLVTDKCDRDCEGCCNKQWDLPNLPLIDDWKDYCEIIITGGEPMLFPEKLISLIQLMTAINPAARYYIYTARPDKLADGYMHLFKYFHGATITLHEPKDWDRILAFDNALHTQDYFNPFQRSLRVNVFKEAGRVRFGFDVCHSLYDWKWNMEWIEDCPLPDGEQFRRIARLW